MDYETELDFKSLTEEQAHEVAARVQKAANVVNGQITDIRRVTGTGGWEVSARFDVFGLKGTLTIHEVDNES